MAVVAELSSLANEFDRTCNAHLTTDLSICDQGPGRWKYTVESIVKAMERVAPLYPSAHVPHLPFTEESFEKNAVKTWQNKVRSNLEKIFSAVGPGEKIAIETLDYPFELVDDTIFDRDLKICLDLGHLIPCRFEIKIE